MRTMLITGGAGFIGSNAGAFFGRRGWKLTVLDNLGRPGARENLAWLGEQGPLDFVEADVRDAAQVEGCLRRVRPEVVLHLAGQVAVTTSLTNPKHDFETNAGGTLNILEAVRTEAPDAMVLYASTNKVYGDLKDLGLHEAATRWTLETGGPGVAEKRPLAFHSPYGCSKGAADQYVLDYTKSFGLQATSLRQSCIYGPRQFGIEDQGWVAWLIIAAATGREITIYGDGKQVRDLLFVDDLCELYAAVIEARDRATGEAFNIGGGYENALSLSEFLSILEESLGRTIPVQRAAWRRGDQKYFVSDNGKARHLLGWEPCTSCREGIARLTRWVDENRRLFVY